MKYFSPFWQVCDFLHQITKFLAINYKKKKKLNATVLHGSSSFKMSHIYIYIYFYLRTMGTQNYAIGYFFEKRVPYFQNGSL